MPSVIKISLPQQRLRLVVNGEDLLNVAVSTAKKGAGELMNSECTPRGAHRIRAKIGENCVINTVFNGRRPTGEIYSAELQSQFNQRDWILTRILWLSGMEPGKNRFGSVDTLRRYIYIHGTPDNVILGETGSHGCIRMNNRELIQLFDLIKVGTRVEISNED